MQSHGSRSQAAYYALARPIAWRFVGTAFVLSALVLIVSSVLLAVLHGSGTWLALIAAVLVVFVIAVAGFFPGRAWVVRTTAEGYQVKLVRGAGTKAAAWSEVESVAATYSHGLPVVVLYLGGDRSTTIPVGLLAVNRDQFVRDIQRHLSEAQAAGFMAQHDHDHAGHDHD